MEQEIELTRIDSQERQAKQVARQNSRANLNSENWALRKPHMREILSYHILRKVRIRLIVTYQDLRSMRLQINRIGVYGPRI